MQVGTGGHELVVAGGAESMSNVPFYSTEMRWGVKGPGVTLHDGLARGRVTAGGRDYPVPGGMLETAENLRREYGISRAEQDQLALASHQRAVSAQRSGVFAEEIIPVTIRTRKGEEVVDTDEHPRADASLEALAGLRPVLGQQDPEATVTAGNASGQNDAAAMCIVTHPGTSRDPRAAAAGPPGVLGGGRRAAQDHGHRPRPREPGRAGARRAEAVRHGPDRAQRGLRGPGAGVHPGMGVRRRPTSSASTCTARESRWAIRSAPPARAS